MCFVHGLGAKSLDKWNKAGHIWIQDDLPNDIKNARIMTFGYNAAYTGDVTSGRIRDFAKQQLEALRLERDEAGHQNPSQKSSTDSSIVLNPTFALRLP